MSETPLPKKFFKQIRKKIKRAKSLSDTILVVPPSFPIAIDIDATPFGWHRIAECKEGDLPYYINAYRRQFFRKINYINGEPVCAVVHAALEQLLQTWKSEGFLMLGQVRPHLESHFGVIQEYLMWQIRERGWDNRPN